MTIRPGCTLRPPERPDVMGEGADMQPLPQSGPTLANPDTGAVEVAAAEIKPVTPADFPYFRHKLHERLAFARSTIRSALLRANEEHYAQIAGQVHDATDESLADLLTDTYFDEIDRDVQGVRDIDAAQRRILTGTYGGCLDCGEPIGWGRLDAYPTAKRCLGCQVRHEQGGKPTPSL